VIAPAAGNVNLPTFLTPLVTTGPLKVYAAPDAGNFEVVDVFYSVASTKNNFYDVNDRWLQSTWVGNRQHLYLDLNDEAPRALARLAPEDPLPNAASFPFPGNVVSERKDGETYSADVQAARASYVLLKTTWHPNWRAVVDGKTVKTVMLSPGFVGVPVSGGPHHIQLRYEPEKWKAILAVLGPLIGLLLIVGERRGLVREPAAMRMPQIAIPARVRVAGGIALIALPVCLALLTSRLPEGHDATEYLPRMVEFHENISNGILLPRWAPDLSHGTGQPLFLFNPPMFYYIAEFWHLLGFDFVKAMNLACISIVFASAAGMFLFGRLYFGELGGWLAAAAYLYAPYFATNLYVRSAWAEFAAFPFFAFALYGFGAYAKSGARKYLLIGAVGFAGVLASHHPAALLFAPLLGAFIVFTAFARVRTLHAEGVRHIVWTVLRDQACGVALGLGLAAFVWVPSLAMSDLVQVRVLLDGVFRYTNHFVYPHQLIDSPWGYGLSVPGDADGMSFSLGWTHLLVLAAIAVLMRRSGDIATRRWVWFFGAASLVICIMMLQDVEPIWSLITLLQYVEFPWRLLGPAAVAIAALIAALVVMVPESKRRTAFVLAMIVLIVPNLSHFRPDHFRDIDMRFWTPQQIAERGIEVTSRAEYRPQWMETTPPYDPRPAEIVAGHAEVQQTARSPIFWAGSIRAYTPATAELRIAYFPGWTIRVDDKEVTPAPAANTGLIRFDVTPGAHRVTATWERPKPVLIGDVISVLALLIGIGALVSFRNRAGEPAKAKLEGVPVH